MVGDSDSKKPDNAIVAAFPTPEGNWQVKIAIAKAARRAARESRNGKPAAFVLNDYGPI